MDFVQKTSCIACREDSSSEKPPAQHWYSTALSALVFLLPKCPFCVVAYTSSMAICGAPSVMNYHVGWGTLLAVGLATVCLGSIAVNYRGKGTRTAMFIALPGLSFLCIGLFTPNSVGWYYAGATLLFLGSVYNGRGYRWLNKLVL